MSNVYGGGSVVTSHDNVNCCGYWSRLTDCHGGVVAETLHSLNLLGLSSSWKCLGRKLSQTSHFGIRRCFVWISNLLSVWIRVYLHT